jgi:aspartate aminotransferase-like enzyme
MDSLKKVYSNVEKDKKNQVGNKDVYTMPLQEFIDEHKDLIKILREGSREELLAEAEEQEEELEECLKEHGMSDDSEEED